MLPELLAELGRQVDSLEELGDIQAAKRALKTAIDELKAALKETHLLCGALAPRDTPPLDDHEIYRQIFHLASQACLVADEAGNIIAANIKAEQLLGESHGQLAGKSLGSMLHEEREADFRRHVEMLASSGEGGNWALRLYKQAGDAIDVVASVVALPVSGGTPSRFLWQIQEDNLPRQETAAVLRMEERLRPLLRNSQEVLLVLDAAGVIQYRGPSASRLLGYSPEEVTGRSIFGVVHPDDQNALRAAFAKVLAEPGSPTQIELRFLHSSGHPVWIEATGANLLEDPNVMGIVVNLRDVTQRKQAEQRLLVSEEEARRRAQEFKTLAENLPDVIVRFGRDLRHLYINPAIERETGIPPEAFIGKLHQELPLPDEVAALWSQRVYEVVQSGQEHLMEFAFPGPDGIRHYQARIVPELGRDGRVESVLAITRDFTAQKRAEAALRNTLAFKDELLNLIPAGVYTVDALGMVTSYNRRATELWGREPDLASEEERFCGSYKLYWPDGACLPHDQTPMAGVLRDGIPVRDQEVIMEQPDGSRLIALVNIAPIKEDAGEITGAINCFLDITERKEAERRKDEFLAALGHELRNPLAAIAGAVALQEGERSAGDELPFTVQVLGRQARHLARIVDDLLDVSRISRGLVELRRERLALNTVVEHALDAIRPAAAERKQELSVSLPEQPVWVEGDLTRLAQVVSNLLSNAVKYTPEGGHIWVSLESDGATGAVRVRDDGRGIAPDFLPQVFDLFARGDRSRASDVGGLGLGLTLVKRLVEMHEGEVQAHSEGPGKGSAFVVRLPLMGEAAQF